MATWRDFASIEIKKTAGANDLPISVGYQNGRPFTVTSPEAFSGPRRMNYGAGATMGRRPLFGDSGPKEKSKTWFGQKVYHLEDEAAKYPDEESDPYYHNILVGGCNAGGEGFKGLSALPFGVLAKGSNRELFRNGEIEKIRAAIEKARKNGKNVRVVGHSWGGGDVARMAADYPDIPFVSIDPVSWTGRLDSLPKNLTILRPDGSTDGWDTNKGAQIFGGQWPHITKGEGRTITYAGDHTTGAGRALTQLHNEVRNQRMAAERAAAERAAAQKRIEEGRKAELLQGVAMRPGVKKETP